MSVDHEAAAQTVIFRNGTVFDGEVFRLDPCDVVVTDGTVTGVYPGGTADAGESDEVVDCTGKTVLPGFIDCHIHSLVGIAGPFENAVKPFSLPYYDAIGRLKDTLACGITTARDAGGADLGVKTALEQGLIAGPRLQIAVTIMSQTGGHGDGHLPSGTEVPLLPSHPGRPSGIADGPDEARRTARTLLRAGADQIKICSTGGVLSPSDDPRHSQFTRAEIEVIVEEAATQGTYVMAHAQGNAGIKNALVSGVRSIEHGIYLDDEAIEMMIQNDSYLVPTLVAPLAVMRAAEAGNSIPPAMLEKAVRVAGDHKNSFAKAAASGVKIAMGTDSGVGPHGQNLEELQLMADGGMDLEQVLAATTSVAGELLGEQLRVGRLAEGFRGDVVVVDTKLIGNDQLATLREHIDGVYQDGVRVA
ncbi:metal-dependent hydrolase family protein [Spelaeicoccus albus]|uniref:Imidazolonepropionase-like amidohydrolase n=1 Tax=Spelaeicoccus albus TaxID=1280376 RepID=A0A7Z0AAA1_9MICO|nr:amidohydrolase family protein [Spelaeicoccus albus]NYI67327.1 imidazolonepropionase-like amidohydrolase [Spelaeicoccus albus]